LPELYDDLHTMPVVIWWKVQKADDALDLIKGKKTAYKPFLYVVISSCKNALGLIIFLFIDKKKVILRHCAKRWDKLNDDFTDYFGVQPTQQKYLKLLGLQQYYAAQYAITKSHYWTTKRLITEAELEDLRPERAEEFNQYEELRSVSMALGGANMNPLEISVIQYYSDKNLAVKKSKEAKSEANKLKAKRWQK